MSTKTLKQTRIETHIRTAYQQLATTPGSWVSLTKLRAALLHIAPATFTTALTAMYQDLVGTGEMYLIPESNQQTLTEWDRRAAVTIGNEARHLIAIHS
jgi:hypothetical protein